MAVAAVARRNGPRPVRAMMVGTGTLERQRHFPQFVRTGLGGFPARCLVYGRADRPYVMRRGMLVFPVNRSNE